MPTDHDKLLQSYFTDVEHLRQTFKQWLAAPRLPKRLLVIHGVGGVGKTSLLRMFRLECKSAHVPVALASGDEEKSVVDILARWAEDLRADDVRLPTFQKALSRYRELYLKVENEAAKTARQVTKGAAKTLVETAASTLPGIGPLLGKLGGMGAEALTDWLLSRGFQKPDVDLLLDPGKKLTEEFLADVTKAAEKRRLILMLDTFEQMSALEDWAGDVARRLSPNVLLVIAGRAVPKWGRTWPEWMAQALVEELKPMSEEDMRELVRRYYATIRGGEPDPKQVEAIIRFARGLPLVVISAVQLWVEYGVENFEAVKPEVVADLVDRLMEGVPRELVPAFEAAAVVRWFDQPILRAMLGQEDVREAYNELRRFPFVRPRSGGFAFHDVVREIIDENLRLQDAERHRKLHERAAAYFEEQLKNATGEKAKWRLGLERLYHCVYADEREGMNLFQEMAERLVSYGEVYRLRELLNDVNNYDLAQASSRLWREYYNARLADLATRHTDAERVYQAIAKNEQAPPRLRAYVLCDWATLLLARRIGTNEVRDTARRLFEESLELAPLDSKLIKSLIELGRIYRDRGDWEKAWTYLNRALSYCQKSASLYDTALVHLQFQYFNAYRGNWKRMFQMHEQVMSVADAIASISRLKKSALSGMKIAWIWTGRYAEAERDLQYSLGIKEKLGYHRYTIAALRDLGITLAFEDKVSESLHYFSKSLDMSRQQIDFTKRELAVSLGFYGIALVKFGRLAEAEDHLKRSLAIKLEIQDTSYLLETFNWLGILSEIARRWADAEDFFQQTLDYRWTGRLYFECGALTGLVRVKHAQGDCAALPPLLAEAEQLAQQYEYNDHLASLRLTQGHVAWDGHIPEWGQGFDAALHYYQLALIHALRYNRFLLDEVLSGRPQGTPLRPIIPECLKRGEEGRRMLIALRDWWQTGINDIGTPRPDTISLLPEGIPLLEAERLAREREPGDGSPQRSVVEQIEAALAGMD